MAKAALIMLVAVLSSCTAGRHMCVPEVRTDTLVITRQQRDSIWMHDSIYVSERQNGDTVFVMVDRWHTRIRAKELHDTIYMARHDSIPYPVEVIKEVPKELSWWQRAKMNAGIAAMLFAIILIVWNAAKIYMKRF